MSNVRLVSIPQVKVANREEVQVNSSADVQLQGLGIQHINNPPLHPSLSQFPLPALVGSGHPPHVLWLPTHWISVILSSLRCPWPHYVGMHLLHTEDSSPSPSAPSPLLPCSLHLLN